MKKQTLKLSGERPLLDLVSYGRGGPHATFQPTQVEHIRRTVHRVPEAIVKVLTRGNTDFKTVAKHLAYIGRNGELSLETDEGERSSGKAGKELLAQWDLDIDDIRRRNELDPTDARKQPKLVYKLMFSMPAGTPPNKVLDAVRNFAREEFALKHRYAFVLHTDEPHPHVHMVIKAVSEQGVRLNIRKATLRQWRAEFARHLRALGVAANATERAVRGEGQKSTKDEIFRAGLRGDSSFLRSRAEHVAGNMLHDRNSTDAERNRLWQTRAAVERGWRTIAMLLERDGHGELASDVRRFNEQLPPVRTERELLAEQLIRRVDQSRAKSRRVR